MFTAATCVGLYFVARRAVLPVQAVLASKALIGMAGSSSKSCLTFSVPFFCRAHALIFPDFCLLVTPIACAGLQVSLGIATLMLHVPVPLAAVHQGGSLALLSFALWFAHALRPLPITAAAAVASRVVTAQRAKTAADVARVAL